MELSQPARFRFSSFGGWADGPQLEATGSFRAAKHEGKWWLVDPEGRLFWSHGATGVAFGGDFTPVSDREHWFASLPERDEPYGRFYTAGQSATYMFYKTRAWTGLDIQEMNLFRKYGADYRDKTARLSHQRMRSWGMNTLAAWSSAEICRLGGTPYTSIVHYEAPALHYRFADVFDPAWEPAVRAAVAEVARQAGDDPWNIGFFVDNERWFGPQPRGAGIAIEAFKAAPTSHAKQRMVELFRKKYGEISLLNKAWQSDYLSWGDMAERREPPDVKVEQVMSDAGDFGMLFAERYFSVCRDAVKQAAPKKMYLGSRFHGHVDIAVVELCGRYADVISYNIYDNPPTGRANQYNRLDLPILITEWGIGSDPSQTPFRDEDMDNPPTPAERAAVVSKYLDASIRHPNIVGTHFFQFRDQPLSGRPDGEALLRGLVNVADTPNFELIQATRRFAEQMYPTRHKQP